MLTRQPVVTIRTKLETSRILQLVAGLIPERQGMAFRYKAGLVGGEVEAKGFTLMWTDGEGQKYQVVGVVRDGPRDRLIRLRFQPDSRHLLLWLPLGYAIFLVLALVGSFTWPWYFGGMAFATASTAATIRFRLVPSYFVDEMTEQLMSALDAQPA